MSYKFKKTLVSWAEGDESRILEIRETRDECISKSLSSKGSQISSATTNSNTFSMAIGMTYEEYASCLTDVLSHLNKGTTPQNRVVGGFNTYE
jgi:hypothetical protein